MHKAHETIWLQVDPDGESYDPEQLGLEDDATWCKDQINANDVKYVRADIAEAELEAARAEIERLENQVQARDAELWGRTQKILQLEQQLAAEQATNMRLREALEHFFPDWRSYTPLNWRYKAVEALSTTSDTSALEAIVKKAGEVMREKCAKEAERDACPAYEYVSDCVPAKGIAKAIRYLPAVTLEDLK